MYPILPLHRQHLIESLQLFCFAHHSHYLLRILLAQFHSFSELCLKQFFQIFILNLLPSTNSIQIYHKLTFFAQRYIETNLPEITHPDIFLGWNELVVEVARSLEKAESRARSKLIFIYLIDEHFLYFLFFLQLYTKNLGTFQFGIELNTDNEVGDLYLQSLW